MLIVYPLLLDELRTDLGDLRKVQYFILRIDAPQAVQPVKIANLIRGPVLPHVLSALVAELVVRLSAIVLPVVGSALVADTVLVFRDFRGPEVAVAVFAFHVIG